MDPVNKVILLAAGDSTRMGRPKSLIQIHGKPLIELQIDAICGLNKFPIVVLGKLHDQILQELPHLKQKAKFLRNSNPDEGQFSSLRIGLLEAGQEPVFVLPLDTPAPPKEIWNALEKELKEHQVVVPRYLNKGGHPVLLNRDFVRKLVGGSIPIDEQRLDLQIRQLDPEQVCKVWVPSNSITVDLDTPQDLEAYFHRL